MAGLKPHPNLPSRAPLQVTLSQIGREIEDRPLRTSSLARIMRKTFDGSGASGAWSWRMAYDLIQAAAVMQVVRDTNSDALVTVRLGCFTEIIAFQLRVFIPHGEGVDTAAILGRITGASAANSRNAA